MKALLFTCRPSSTPSHSDRDNITSPPIPIPTRPHKNPSEDTVLMEQNIHSAESMIKKWDLDTPNLTFSSLFVDDDRKEANDFLEAVTGLQTSMHHFLNLNSNFDKLSTAQKLMPVAIKRLKKEFHLILSSNRDNLDSAESFSSRSCSDSKHNYTTTMADLKSIADCMTSSGYGKECVDIYRLVRKSIIDETLVSRLSVDKLMISHSKMQKMDWNVLEPRITKWIETLKIAIKTLFCREKTLCGVVFSSSENSAASCFAATSRDAAVDLFGFAENFGKIGKKKVLSPDKIFRALDMYKAISELWPEIESEFSHESMSAVMSAATAALKKLAEAVRIMLTQFEAAIKKDTLKPPACGGVHPLTRYVMNFLVFLGDYSGEILDIITDAPLNTTRTPLPQLYFSSPTSNSSATTAASITARLVWLILVLLCKLDAKAVSCKDAALSYLFLANNLNYVVLEVRNSNLGLLIGLDWIWKYRSKVNKYTANYERMSWSKVITSLPEDQTAEISPDEAKECFKRFNLGFEEMHKKQSSWVIPDPELRDEVKMSLAKKLVPGYRALYEKHRGKYTRGIGDDAVVRYTPEDLNNYLSDLFFPATGSGGSTTSS